MVGEDSGPHGNSLCEELGRPSQISRSNQTLLTSRQWRLQFNSPICPGFNLTLPFALYQKLQVGKASLLITSLGAGVNHAVREALEKEGKQQRVNFQPYTIGQESFSSDPGASRKAISRLAKRKVEKEQHEKRLKHSTSLKVQGRLFTITHTKAASVWARSTQSLPSAQMKFALNATTDTLPHNANIALWRKDSGLSAACKLCGERQTLCHILNNCKVALDLRRYNQRHDEILRTIEKFVKEHITDDVSVLADLSEQYHFPASLACSDLRPDLVAHSDLTKTATIVELTVCFETNFEAARSRKEAKYSELIEEV